MNQLGLAAVGVITSIMVGLCAFSGFIIRLMIQNAVLRLEAKIEAIDLKSLHEEVNRSRDFFVSEMSAMRDLFMSEIKNIREWRHKIGPKEMVYDDYGDRIEELEKGVKAIDKDVARIKERYGIKD